MLSHSLTLLFSFISLALMPDLTDLPVELIDEILSLAFISKDAWNDGLVDINGLSRLLLVNRKHHQAFLHRVYPQWTYNGALHSYSSLWKFLRTVAQTQT